VTQDTSTQTWLTQEAFDRLTAEYEERQGPIRENIVNRIQAAREEGDLKENGGYHAAKDEQGKNEARIRQLRQILEDVRIGTPDAAAGEVAQGQVVTIAFAPGDNLTFLLGSREETATATVDVYSPTSPLGEAVLGAHVGDSVSYVTPAGKSVTVEVVSTAPYTG
jgi:transcription elongation factor GreA